METENITNCLPELATADPSLQPVAGIYLPSRQPLDPSRKTDAPRHHRNLLTESESGHRLLFVFSGLCKWMDGAGYGISSQLERIILNVGRTPPAKEFGIGKVQEAASEVRQGFYRGRALAWLFDRFFTLKSLQSSPNSKPIVRFFYLDRPT